MRHARAGEGAHYAPMKAVQDLNYKVALAQGLKRLQATKLRQAEGQFRYLVSKFPQADGGYRGLARVQIELGDRSAALTTLRDGAAALSRANERALAIDLLREATALDPLDLSLHRGLSAALALAGDVGAAAQEYVRFSNAELAAGDPEGAKLEASYALETLGEIPALHELAAAVGLQLRTVRRLAPEPEPPSGAQTEAMRPGRGDEVEHLDPFELEERAMALFASGHADAGRAGVEAARALADAGKLQAASDLLLQLIASGTNVREAERALIPVAQALGMGEIAAERERLLATAAQLG